jgi:hypothetical protein
MLNAPFLKLTDRGESINIYAGVTLKGSYVAGYAFIDSTSTSFAGMTGKKISIDDGAGHIISGYIKAQGTTIAYGSELVTNGTMSVGDPPTGWTGAGYSQFATKTFHRSDALFIRGSASAGGRAYQKFSAAAEGFLLSYSLLGGIDGSDRGHPLIKNTAAYGYDMPLGQITGDPVTLSGIITHGSADAYIVLCCDGTNSEVYWDTVTIKQVTAPSSSGVTIVSTTGGTTYNWTSNTGVTFSSASYTVTISD